MEQRYTPHVNDLLVDLICNQIWRESTEFIKRTHRPKDTYYATFIWSTFLYSIRDVLEKNNLLDSVRSHYVISVSRILGVPMTNIEQLGGLKRFQVSVYDLMIEENIDPRTPTGASHILFNAAVFQMPDEENIEALIPDDEDVFEFILSVASLTDYVIPLISRANQKRDMRSDSPAASPVPSVVQSRPAPVAATSVQPKPTPVQKVSVPQTPTPPAADANDGTKLFTILTICLSIVMLICLMVAVIPSVRDSKYSLGNTSQTTPTNAPKPTTNSQTQPKPQTQQTIPATTAPTAPKLTKLSRPANGHIFTYPKQTGESPLCIEASLTKDCYVILTPRFSKTVVMSFYVRASESFEVDVPDGDYDIYFASGSDWYGTTHLFGEDTVYQKCDDYFDFADGYGWTVTLYYVLDGNMDTDYINSSDFPQ